MEDLKETMKFAIIVALCTVVFMSIIIGFMLLLSEVLPCDNQAIHRCYK